MMNSRFRLISIIALLFCALCYAHNPDGGVSQYGEYSHEWHNAMQFLNERGIYPHNLESGFILESLIAFTDKQACVYAVVAKEDYEKYLDNPVVVWGNGEMIWKGSFSLDNYLLYYYDDLLQSFKNKGIIYSAASVTVLNDRKANEPLLGDIKLGQEAPYNKEFPILESDGMKEFCIVGCGPVALAQVLTYHHSKTPPSGTASFTTIDGSVQRVDLSRYAFSWNGDLDEMASLMLCSAASINATVSIDLSSSAMANVKPALLNNWHYSPKCTYIQKSGDLDMLSSIQSEIDEGRPVILADTTHMFVCDGYYKDYIHLNPGWEGYGNGYYRAFVSESGDSNLLPFNELLIGIQPMEESDKQHLDLRLEHAGQLAQMLTPQQRDQVTSLRVSGYLNGNDLAVIRQMAGAGKDHGSLMELDLSDATIVNGGCYVTRNAGNMVVSGYFYDKRQKVKYSYNMSNLKPGQWKKMQEMGLTNKPARVIKAAGNGKYTVSWYAIDSTIGQYMFDGCDNLCSIVLPRNTKEVKENAFFGCWSLIQVKGLPQNTSRKAFNSTKIRELR